MRCPVGHDSSTTDYCSICGTPMQALTTPVEVRPDAMAEVRAPASLEAESPAQPNPATATQTCPVCGSVASADAFFCESCGYDFLTGSLPRSAQAQPEAPAEEPAAEVAAEESAPVEEAADVTEPEPVAVEAPADVTEPEPVEVEAPAVVADSEPAAEPSEPAEPAPPVVNTFSLDDIPKSQHAENPLVVTSEPRQHPRLLPKVDAGDALSLGAPEW